MVKKNILITGASSGLGMAMALHLAELGHTVYGTSRKTSSNLGAIRMLELDITNDQSVEQCIARFLSEVGHIDVLINNAGAGLCGAIEDTTSEEAHWQMETNFFGPARMIRCVIPHMRSQRQGRIITVSSLAGLAALPYQPYYSASKFALEALNESLRLELSGSGIDSTTINPGDFKTGFTSARVFSQQAKRGVQATQLANTVGIYERDELNGADPKLVAQLAARLVMAKRLDIRYTVGRIDQRFGMLLKKIIPATWFERIMKITYALP